MDSTADADLGFSFRRTKDGSVAISRGNRVVTVLRGRAAQQFLLKAAVATVAVQQQLMARATGNYKRGNERHVVDSTHDRDAGDVAAD